MDNSNHNKNILAEMMKDDLNKVFDKGVLIGFEHAKDLIMAYIDKKGSVNKEDAIVIFDYTIELIKEYGVRSDKILKN